MEQKTDLKKVINESGLKVKFIAEKIGISRTALSSFVSGKRPLSAKVQLRLFEFLDLSKKDFKKAS